MSKLAKRILEIYREMEMKPGAVLSPGNFRAAMGVDWDSATFADALEELVKAGNLEETTDTGCFRILKY